MVPMHPAFHRALQHDRVELATREPRPRRPRRAHLSRLPRAITVGIVAALEVLAHDSVNEPATERGGIR